MLYFIYDNCLFQLTVYNYRRKILSTCTYIKVVRNRNECLLKTNMYACGEMEY